MSIKPISSFFPLIDDPANIFYSKLKSIFLSFINITPNVSSVNRYIYRVDVPIQNHYPVHVNFNTRIQSTRAELKLCLSQDSPTYVYVGLRLDTKFITNKEITVTGETIPVDENRTIITHLKRGNPFYYVNISSFSEEQSVLIEYDIHKVPTHIYFLIGKIIKDDGALNLESVNIIKGLESKDKSDISFSMLYKPEIGRKWVINQNDWELYSIDSDLREILIDSSTHAFNGGAFLPVQNCPFKDRTLKLTFGEREYNQQSCTITVYEQEYYPEHPVNLEVRCYGEYSLYSNHNVKDISLLFSSLSFKNNTKKTLYQEEVSLALSYILGIDIRFFILSSQSILSPYTTQTINRQSYYQNEIHTCSNTLSNAITLDLIKYFTLQSGDLFSLPSYENDYVRIPILPNCLGYTKQLYLTRYVSFNVDFFYSLSSSLHNHDGFPIRPRGTEGKCLYDFILSLPTLGLSCIEPFNHSVLGE